MSGMNLNNLNLNKKSLIKTDLCEANFCKDNVSKGSDKLPCVLSIAGSDPGGGAGIQGDIKTIISNGAYGMAVISALTVQNTMGVKGVAAVPTEIFQQQISCICDDIRPDSIKIGMLSNGEQVEILRELIWEYSLSNIVIDPVMISTSGKQLMGNSVIEKLMRMLFPIATLVTPNIPEARKLLELKNIDVGSDIPQESLALELEKALGCPVLVKGGHLYHKDVANDILCKNGEITCFSGKYIRNPNTHGTGCALSSAIAAYLAKGHSLEESIDRSKGYLNKILKSPLNLGKGNGPLDHGLFCGN